MIVTVRKISHGGIITRKINSRNPKMLSTKKQKWHYKRIKKCLRKYMGFQIWVTFCTDIEHTVHKQKTLELPSFWEQLNHSSFYMVLNGVNSKLSELNHCQDACFSSQHKESRSDKEHLFAGPLKTCPFTKTHPLIAKDTHLSALCTV